MNKLFQRGYIVGFKGNGCHNPPSQKLPVFVNKIATKTMVRGTPIALHGLKSTAGLPTRHQSNIPVADGERPIAFFADLSPPVIVGACVGVHR